MDPWGLAAATHGEPASLVDLAGIRSWVSSPISRIVSAESVGCQNGIPALVASQKSVARLVASEHSAVMAVDKRTNAGRP